MGNNAQRAYRYGGLALAGVINDTLDDRDLVLVFNSDSNGVSVFDRRLGERVLTFEDGESPLYVTDAETGSTWNKTTGVAEGGELEGQRLTTVPFFFTFWFAWILYDPPR